MTYSLIKLNSARNCFRYIIRAFEITDIHLPYYLCPAIRNIAFKEHCRIHFYHIDNEFRPIKKFKHSDFILYPNYWGICSDIVEKMAEEYPNLIVDNAHSFFSPFKGIACFNSLRKFFPEIRDGAFLYTTKTMNITIEIDEFDYEPHILDYNEICKNEARIDNSCMKLISHKTGLIYEGINKQKHKEERINKFKQYNNEYGKDNLLHINLKENDIPFCYPFLAKDEIYACKVVEEFRRKGITIYRYWANMPESYNEQIMYKRLVAIPLL